MAPVDFRCWWVVTAATIVDTILCITLIVVLMAPKSKSSEQGDKIALYSPIVGWLVDTCVGGEFSFDVEQALWFDSEEEIEEAIEAAEISLDEYVFTKVRMK